MQGSVFLIILILAELIVLPKIPAALARGAVPLNPLGWFGYAELQEATADRRADPLAYWLIVGVLAVAAAVLALFIYAVIFRAAS
jgi:hypothetical protein